MKYVYSTRFNARFAHLYKKSTLTVTACKMGFGGEYATSDDIPEGKRLCLRCQVFLEGKRKRYALTPEEWDIILTLVYTGLSESPWRWSRDWPEEVTGERTREIVEKLRNFVYEEKKTT